MKKRMLYLILCISVLCGILSGCGSDLSVGNIGANKTEKMFAAYASYYEKFYEEHKECNDLLNNMNSDSSMYDCAGKIILENNIPIMAVADLVSVTTRDELVYDVYFFSFEGGRVKERTVIKNIVAPGRFMVQSMGDSVYVLVEENREIFKLTEDSYENLGNTLDEEVKDQTVYSIFRDRWYETYNFTDYIVNKFRLDDAQATIACLNGTNFIDYLNSLEDKEITSVCKLDALYRDYLVDNRYMSDFKLYYMYNGLPLIYYEADDLANADFEEQKDYIDIEAYNLSDDILIPHFLLVSTYSYEVVKEYMNMELPEEIDGVSVLNDCYIDVMTIITKNIRLEAMFQEINNKWGQEPKFFVKVPEEDDPYVVVSSDNMNKCGTYRYEPGKGLERIDIGLRGGVYIG